VGLTTEDLVKACRERLSLFRKAGDAGDQFADDLVVLLHEERLRRNRIYPGWNERAVSDPKVRALEEFDNLNSTEVRQ
jgi:hypothetical protein